MSKKLLMTTMALDIGGAETHIFELSRELARRGWDVTVASNGGVYVEPLVAVGVRHVKLPLHKKTALAESMAGLEELIRREKYDIVHAHARIPAYVCGNLQRKLGFPFAVTCHGVYKATPFWRSMSRWGDLSLAVSYDIKDYLIENYGIPSDNIGVTINGIDTERFSSSADASGVEAEFGLSGGHRIIYVSRIDRECAQTGFQLVEAAPALAEKWGDLELVLVGAGTAFDELKIKAEEANRRIGRRAVILTGMRTDIDKFMSCGDIFVGVSRSCLEAMSAELPVVLSGAQGYLGIFSEANLAPALDTNFCCRGYGDSTVAALIGDINALFEKSPEERAEMGRYNRATVMREYSVSRMADDAEALYAKLLARRGEVPSEVILGGYYGFGNMGDDSLLQLVIERLREVKPGIGITVLSRRPEATAKAFGVRSIDRFDLAAIAREMKRAKLLIYGGGSILQTNSSSRSLTYYITIMKMAKRYGLKLMLWGNGIGPITGERNLAKTRRILSETDVVTLRESASLEELKRLGAEPGMVHVTSDPAFALSPAEPGWVAHIAERLGLERDRAYFAVSPRRWKGSSPDFEARLGEAVRRISEKYRLTPVYIAMQPSRDLALCNSLSQKLPGRVITGLSATELLGIVSKMKLVIGMRLHVLIYAVSSAVPAIGLSYDPKIDALLDMASLPYRADVADLDPDALVSMAGEIMERHDEISAHLSESASKLRARAGEDAKFALELLE